MIKIYACVPKASAGGALERSLNFAWAIVAAESPAAARRALLQVGLRGKPTSGGDFAPALENPGVVYWQTYAQMESEPEEWNIGVHVSDYAATLDW